MTPWTVARKAPLSWDSPGKNTGMVCHFLLQEIFPAQESNPSLLCLLYWQADSLGLVPPGKPHIYWMLKKLFDEIMKENMCMNIAPACFLSLSSRMEHECDAKVHPEPWILDDRMER